MISLDPPIDIQARLRVDDVDVLRLRIPSRVPRVGNFNESPMGKSCRAPKRLTPRIRSHVGISVHRRLLVHVVFNCRGRLTVPNRREAGKLSAV